jgi:hypothetical protein
MTMTGQSIETLTVNMTKGDRTPAGLLDALISKIQTPLPTDYVAFIGKVNGAEGPLGGAYLRLWSIEEIDELNREYSVDEFAPGILLFGTDAEIWTAVSILRPSHPQL